MSSPAPETSAPPSPAVRWLQWSAVCVAGAAGFALFAARLPGRVRLIGLFAIAFGLIAGWGMALAAQKLRVPLRWQACLFATIVVAVSEVGLTLESWRLYVIKLQEVYSRPVEIEMKRASSSRFRPRVIPAAIFVTQKTEAPSPQRKSKAVDNAKTPEPPTVPPGGLIKEAHAARRQALEEESSFSFYLRYRVKRLGDWPAEAAVLFWLGEVLAGALAGGWLFRRTVNHAA